MKTLVFPLKMRRHICAVPLCLMCRILGPRSNSTLLAKSKLCDVAAWSDWLKSGQISLKVLHSLLKSKPPAIILLRTEIQEGKSNNIHKYIQINMRIHIHAIFLFTFSRHRKIYSPAENKIDLSLLVSNARLFLFARSLGSNVLSRSERQRKQF